MRVLHSVPGTMLSRSFPAGKHITFLFRLDHGSSSNPSALSEISELRERTVLLETIIEEAPIGLILCNEDGNILYMNKKQEENSRKKTLAAHRPRYQGYLPEDFRVSPDNWNSLTGS